MNDATELESSFDGAIGFFQSLRRKLGTLETETSAQQDRLRAIATSVATLQQDWQIDRQSLANLASGSHAQAGQLAEIVTDGRRLEAQVAVIENRIADFQQDQQHLQQTLATLTTDLHTQHADLRQEWQTILEQQAAPIAQIEALEQQISVQTREMHSLLLSIQALSHDARTTRDGVKALESQFGQHDSQLEQLTHTVKYSQERLDQVSANAETQSQHLQQLESTLDKLSQATTTGAETVREQLEEQQTRFDDLTGSLATVWQDAQTLQETVREQFEEQQTRFDDLTGSLATIWQDAQALQEEVGRLSGEFETQRHAVADVGQTRQDLQKQQERLKHLETLMGKVSADTNSTRQILNVLQTDFTNQSDLLRELDQNWRDRLAAYQDNPESGPIAPLVTTPPPPATAPAQLTQLAQLADDLAASQQEYDGLQQELSTVQIALTSQGERLTELHTALQQQLHSQQQRFGELEAALNHLQQPPESAADAATAADLADLHETLAAQTGTVHELRQQLHSQQQRFGELEAALTHLQQPPESAADAATAADLADLHETLAAQTGAVHELRQQLHSQQQRFDELEAALTHLQQPPAPASAPESAADAATAADLADLHETLATQTGAVHELRQQLHSQQQHFGELEAALTHLQQPPAPESAPESAADAATAADLADLHETLAAQTGAVNDLREVTQQRFSTLENHWLDFQHAADSLGDLHKETQDLRQQLARLDAAITQQPQQSTTDDPHTQELQQNLETLQQTLIDLEARMAGQAQAFSGNFEQFRGLRTDIQSLQHDLAALQSLPDQLHTFDQSLSAQDRQISQLHQTVQRLQQDAQQLGDAIQTREGSSVEELEARLNEQREQMDSLTATLETVQTDARLTQEKVVTMATNVAKRIFEFQNQLATSETAQTERLQEAEQKLIQLQAALEILQTPHKTRRWFKMPATLATVALTVGTAFLGILAKVIWTIG
jgi:chromosome segregation ATPase